MTDEELELDTLSFSEVCLRCIVDTKNLSDDDKIYCSSVFMFGGFQWILAYSRLKGAYSLNLVDFVIGERPNAFYVSVHVERSINGRIVSVLVEHKRFIEEHKWEYDLHKIWKKEEEEILKALPEFRRNGVIKFIVKLKVELEEKDSVVTQTKRSILEDVDPSCLESLLKDLQQILIQSSDHHDVHFRCAGQTFKAHGAIICARAPLIYTMLGSDMVEGRTIRTVDIPDMKPEVFRLFLEYLYTGKLPELTVEVALSLYESGDKYAVLGLARTCYKYLVEHLTVQNACEMLAVADAHSDKDFTEKVIAYMLETKVPQTSEKWSAFFDDHPKLANEVLQRVSDAFLK